MDSDITATFPVGFTEMTRYIDDYNSIIQLLLCIEPINIWVQTVYAMLSEMYPNLLWLLERKHCIEIDAIIALECDHMPVNTPEEVMSFLISHGKSEKDAENTVRTLRFIQSLEV